jgi:hypothetical protein
MEENTPEVQYKGFEGLNKIFVGFDLPELEEE